MLPKFVGSRSQEELLSLARAANYPNPNSLERRALRAILQGKDVVIDTGTSGDPSGVLLLPLFMRKLHSEAGMASLVIAATADSVRRLGRRFKSLAQAAEYRPSAALIGIDDNIRKELQILGKPLDALIATPERLIDHIRRDNLKLSSVRRVAIELPADYAETGFDKDIFFIYSKLGTDVQTVATIPEMTEDVPPALPLRHPQLIKAAESERPACSAYRVEQEQLRHQLLADLFFAEGLKDMLVLCPSGAAARSLHDELVKQGVASRCVLQSGSRALVDDDLAQELDSGRLDALVVDSCDPGAELPRFSTLIYLSPPTDSVSFAKASERLASRGGRRRILMLYSRDEEGILRKIEEVQQVETGSTPSSEEVLKGRVSAIVKRIKESEDSAELNRYRKIVRRTVPFFFRSSFAAFLLRELLGKQETPAAQGEMRTLFVSIGKNRRVFPRDLSRLFAGALQIKPTSIGPIKVLDNYSFVDVPQDLAEKAIKLLDAKDFRGRKITVNHARKREDAT